MSGSSVKRTIIAISAALAVSAATVGATISPVQASTIQVSGAAHG
jgi:C4-dicarboxylate transporter